ncbi:MAG: hypothetical protein GY822_03510 [Deltaproteobacteria bacterium]|nr:hypothetical protein [Deltaproteobacteria bacterium]
MNPRANALLCTTADSAPLSRISASPASTFVGRFASLLFGAFLLSGCGSLISPSEPDDAGPEPITACQADSECGADQRCDVENFCETDPSCEEGGPCIEMCFGRCVDIPSPIVCFDDTDCGDDQYCQFSNTLPADGPAAIVAAQGECIDNPTPTGCFSDLGCENGDVCDTLNYCDAPPGCEPGMDCPAVCYGRCVPPNSGCFDDSECADGEFCRFSNAMPAAPGEEGAPGFRPEQGVCVADECAEMDIALPACPPNTIPVTVGGESCGEVICQPIDECAGLDPFTCDEAPGCHTENIPLPCDCAVEPGNPDDPNADPMPCLCEGPVEVICLPDHTCDGLNEYECEQNPECEGYFFDEGYDCDPTTGETCIQPEPGFICTERTVRDGCRDSRDCNSNESCEVFTICTECIPDPNGDVTSCLSECWEVGECVVTDRSCYDLAEWECLEDSRCQLTDWDTPPEPVPPCPDPDCGSDPVAPAPPPQCEPRPNDSCVSDNECGPGQYCEIEEWCPPCNVDDPDFACLAPCWVEGVCVDGREPPRGCGDNDTCGPNEECQVIEVCEGGCGTAPPPDDNGGASVPPDCTTVCYEEALCVPTTIPDVCYFNEDCGLGFECTIDYDTCGANPNGLIACPGTCNQVNPDDQYCVENADCRDGQRCATELEICYVPPGGPYDVCYSLCVEGDPVEPPANICLEDADCTGTERCATELEVCICDPNDEACTICYSSCVPLDTDPPTCADVIVWASETRDGECFEFSTPCDVPEGWFECGRDTDPGAP